MADPRELGRRLQRPSSIDERAVRIRLTAPAAALPDVETVDIGGLYPDGDINLDAEVDRLLATDRLVLQFPVQWYSTPPLLKAWQDTVLTRMYYINPAEEGERLRGLPVLVAATAGNEPSAYTPTGANLFPLNELLKPLRATANRCFWEWDEPFLTYRANKATPKELAEAGSQYAKRLAEWYSAPADQSVQCA